MNSYPGIVFRVAGGIGLALLGASMMGFAGIPTALGGLILLVAGIALLAGF